MKSESGALTFPCGALDPSTRLALFAKEGCSLTDSPLFRWASGTMHLLYLDESGSVADPHQRYFVLAGVSVFERMTHWVEQPLNEIARRFAPNDPYSLELHGSPMRSGREGWKAFPLQARLQALRDCLNVVAEQQRHRRGVRLFGAVIKKASVAGLSDPVEHAFEQLISRLTCFCSDSIRSMETPNGA